MRVTLHYETQLKRTVGIASETIEVPDGAGVSEIIRAAAEKHGDSVRAMLLDDQANVRRSVLIFVGDEQIGAGDTRDLIDGSTLTLMSPISGG
jgi:molybdopterin converting factor small subunit